MLGRLPIAMSGIGPMLPMQTITLPNGQTVQIPEINMEEVNANLLAAGITPQVSTPAITPSLDTANPDFFNPDGTPKIMEMGVGFPGGPSFPELPATTLPDLPGTGSLVTPPPVTTPTPAATEGSMNPNLATTLPDIPNTANLTPLAPVTPPPAPREDMPFVPSVRQVATGLDPLTEQLLFGLGGEGGFIPGAMRAAEKVFFDEEGKPVVIEEQVAGFSPDQLRAQELARQGVGIQDRFISGAEDMMKEKMV